MGRRCSFVTPSRTFRDLRQMLGRQFRKAQGVMAYLMLCWCYYGFIPSLAGGGCFLAFTEHHRES